MGKTSILYQITEHTFSNNYKPTIGSDLFTTEVKYNDEKYKIMCWDTAGAEQYRSIVNSYYKGTDGCIIVYDYSTLRTFKSVDFWKNEYIKNSDNDINHIPILLVANKIDKHITDDPVLYDNMSNWSKQHGFIVLIFFY